MMKDTNPVNPKDRVGVSKWRQIFAVPPRVLFEIGVGMLEGALKYGRFNYRITGVRSSIYVDAAIGHIFTWVEGEDTDPDSGLSHITKAICSLVVLRDAMIEGNLEDDRPPSHQSFKPHQDALGSIVAAMFDRYQNVATPLTNADRTERALKDYVDATDRVYGQAPAAGIAAEPSEAWDGAPSYRPGPRGPILAPTEEQVEEAWSYMEESLTTRPAPQRR